MSIEALKLALEALESAQMSNYGRDWLWPDTAHPTAMAMVGEAITALRQAIEQAEKQEPVVEHAPCQGMNCGITRTDQEHSPECQAEHAATIAGGVFVKMEQAEKQEPVTVLPDGSAFAVMSYPLPKDHWLYAEREYRDGEDEPVELGKPILTHQLRDSVVSAVRYAVRGATNCGKEVDFDPDALVRNAVYALCGPYGGVYTSPPPRQPLTQQDMTAEIERLKDALNKSESRLHEVAVHCEQVERNRDAALLALRQEEQAQPVAWKHEYTDPRTKGRDYMVWRNKPKDYELCPGDTVTPLYTAPPPRQPLFKEFIQWAGAQGYDCAHTCNSDTGEWIALNPMTVDLWKAWQAAHGIKENT